MVLVQVFFISVAEDPAVFQVCDMPQWRTHIISEHFFNKGHTACTHCCNLVTVPLIQECHILKGDSNDQIMGKVQIRCCLF